VITGAKPQATTHRRKQASLARSGKSIGMLLSDIGQRHRDLLCLVRGAAGEMTDSRLQHCANRYARAVSLYRKAVMEVVTALQADAQGVCPRSSCRDLRWKTVFGCSQRMVDPSVKDPFDSAG
jgi:hypothetical protein